MNRLARESSPYLLQHADNPVDWYAWSEEAFALARETDRPLLLSIGYSACHWCHVMERESFADPLTAAVLNTGFVPVKVDREERPDVDQVYMRAVQAMTGHGGWPLTVFLTPEGVPFYGGTYFPPERRQGMPSFREVLAAVRHAWERDRTRVQESAGKIRQALANSATARLGGDEAAPTPDAALATHAARALATAFDAQHGGFGQAPKFPQPMLLGFLLRHAHRTGDEQARAMALHTLRRMAAGGMRDHLGGGFHRYSVDARWLVPHFEKMLYDNALLARAYLEGWQESGDEALRVVCESTIEYVLGDLRHPEGGFLAARDADSEGEEGRYYVWTPEEVDAVLGPHDGPLFRRFYDVSAAGNFEGRNILHRPHDPGAIARAEGVAPEAIEARLAAARAKLLAARATRPEPFRDTKVIMGWSALTVRTLAEAGGALGHANWLDTARSGARFLLDRVRSPSGGLLHVWTEGMPKIPALLDDVAALGNALLSLHQATLEPEWLPEVERLAEDVLARFWSAEEGVFYDSAVDAETLVVRPREVTDNALPSGSSLAIELLLRAGRLLEREDWLGTARGALAREAGAVARWPTGFGQLLSALEAELAGPVEVVIVGERADPATRALLGAALRPLVPARLVTGAAPGEPAPLPMPLLEGKALVGGQPAAYLCRDRVCGLPITDPKALEEELRQ